MMGGYSERESDVIKVGVGLHARLLVVTSVMWILVLAFVGDRLEALELAFLASLTAIVVASNVAVSLRLESYANKIKRAHQINFKSACSELPPRYSRQETYDRTFPTHPKEKLIKTFGCKHYNNTNPGFLYISNFHLAFAPRLSSSSLATLPTAAQPWTYFRVMIPLQNVIWVKGVQNTDWEDHIRIATTDANPDFIFTHFDDYDEAITYLTQHVLPRHVSLEI